MQINGKIYKITNLINGKVYIGQTVRSIEKRWKEHYNNPSCRILFSAICKYGKKNFKIQQVDSSNDINDLNKKEQEYIEMYNSLSPFGYNIREGGNGKFVDEISKQKMSKSQKKLNKKPFRKHPRAKKVINKETGKIYNSLKEVCLKYNLNYSTLRSKLQGQNGNDTPFSYLYNGKLKKYIGSGKNQGTAIICLNTGKKFKTIKEAANVLNLPASSISAMVNNKLKNVKGFIFQKIEG